MQMQMTLLFIQFWFVVRRCKRCQILACAMVMDVVKKDSCYRVKATPSKYQSYSNFEEYLDKDGNCKHYILDGRMECTM